MGGRLEGDQEHPLTPGTGHSLVISSCGLRDVQVLCIKDVAVMMINSHCSRRQGDMCYELSSS